jgi:ABC-type Zn uptake system ZnuABC Zn-binding protein ZnuA
MGSQVSTVVTIVKIVKIVIDVIIYVGEKLKEILEKLRKKFRNRNKSRRELIEEYNLQQLEENERMAERNRTYYNKW